MIAIPLTIDAALAGAVRVAVVRAEPVAAGARPASLDSACAELERRLRARWSGREPAEIEGLGAARELYRRFGIDPTRHRPSSEALLRRVLRGERLPSIAAPVDVANLLALEFLLPLGLYDAAKLEVPVVLRRGEEGESYPGIRKEVVHLAGRPLLADRRGPFGNPTSDSARTSIDGTTRSIWLVVFAPGGYATGALEAHRDLAARTIAAHLAPPGLEVSIDGRLLG